MIRGLGKGGSLKEIVSFLIRNSYLTYKHTYMKYKYMYINKWETVEPSITNNI